MSVNVSVRLTGPTLADHFDSGTLFSQARSYCVH
jgi:hypothetical protein